MLVLGADGVVALAGVSPAFARRLDGWPWSVDEPQASRQPTRVPDPVTRRPTPDVSARDGGPTPRPNRRRDRRFPFVAEHDENDCGAACVAMIARHHGRAASLTLIRDAAASGQQGSSLTGIVQAGAAVGLAVTPYRISPDREDALALPAIIHWEDRHWVVLVALGPDHAVIADPATGVRRITRPVLSASWSGFAASVRPTDALHERRLKPSRSAGSSRS